MRSLAFALIALCLSFGSLVAQPNVLFIAVDDLNDWIEPYGGHPDAQTPNIQALANQGIRFDRAYCTGGWCYPSRTAIMTGVACANSEAYHASPLTNNPYLDPFPTIGEYFSDSTAPANGYYTISRGKVFHPWTDEDNWWDEWSGTPQGAVQPLGTEPYNGYPPSPSNCETLCFDWAPTSGQPDQTLDYQTASWAKHLLAGNHPTNFQNKPFFMAVGIFRPHLPWYVPQRYLDLYDPATVALPIADSGRPVSPLDLADILGPDGVQSVTPQVDFTWALANTAPPFGTSPNPNDNAMGEAVAAYLACVSYADACVGEILAGLESGPYRDNTIVVLWSDHGFLLGEKSHFKKSRLWERVARVPLIIKLPNNDPLRQVGVCDRVVSLLDLYPTLTEYCGLPSGINPLNDGKSFAPLLHDLNLPRDYVAVTSSTNDLHSMGARPIHSVRDDRWRYTRHYDGTEELYDHDLDPTEYNNLAASAQPLHRAAIARLQRALPQARRSHRGWRLPYTGRSPETLALWRMDTTDFGTASGQLQLVSQPPGPTPVVEPVGRFGAALDTAGSSGTTGAVVVDSAGLFPAGPDPDISVEAWIKFRPGGLSARPSGTQFIVNKCMNPWGSSGGYSLVFTESAGRHSLVWSLADGFSTYVINANVTGRLFEDTWHHVAGTWSLNPKTGKRVTRLYLDGWEVAERALPASVAMVNDPGLLVSIGGHGLWYGSMFEGLVDEVCVSDVAYEYGPMVPGALNWAQGPIAKPDAGIFAAYDQQIVIEQDVIDLNGDPIQFSKLSYDSGPGHPVDDWLLIDPTGRLTGTPTAFGTYRWTVRATAGGESVDAVFEIFVGVGASSHNLISNGTFEALPPGLSGPMTPYVTGGWTFEHEAGVNLGGVNGFAGNPAQHVRLQSNGDPFSDPTASYTAFGLTPGATYMVSWDLALRAPGGGSTDPSFGVFLDVQDLSHALHLESYLGSVGEYTGRSATFVATSTSQTVIFAAELDSRSNGAGNTDVSYNLDNVALVELTLSGQPNSAEARLEINGAGVGTLAGPFPVIAPQQSSLNLAWSGPPNTQAVILFGLGSSTHVPVGCLGLLDVGTPPFYSDVFSFGPFAFDAFGHQRASYPIPAGLELFGAMQGLVLQPGGTPCLAVFTATFPLSD